MLIVAFSGCFMSAINGQVGFLDSTNIWTEVHYYLIGHQSFRYTISSESTEFNDKTYYEILYSSDEEGGTWQNTSGFIRYEDQQLFGAAFNGEILIFDYSLEVSDTLFTEPVYVVTDIDSVVLENGEKRKRLHTQCPFGSWGDWTIYWIEGMPSSAGLIGHHSICAADAGSALLCIWKNDELLYSNLDQDSCWLLAVSTLDIEETSVRILANPVQSWLDISDPDQLVQEITVYDFTGRRIYQGDESNINLENVPQGNYMVSIKLKSGHYIAQKIIKL